MNNLLSKSIFCVLLFVSLHAEQLHAFQLPVARITVKVQDEEGQPIEGARVGIGFFVGGTAKENAVVGSTDSHGIFQGTSESLDVVGFNVTKNDYYKSVGEYHYTKKDQGKWQPWNPECVITLRKIMRPVPMYARDTHKSGLKIPEVGKEIGFDLMEYDWVSPYGIGKHADFIFKIDNRFVSDRDFETTLTLTFTNNFDGIQPAKDYLIGGSIFKLSRKAPATGYQQTLSRTIKRSPGKAIENNFQEANNFYFRVRSAEKNGKLMRAMYGKIQGNIEVYPTVEKTVKIFFKYYLNPDFTQNLEYDEMQNLFLKLRDRRKLEWVGLE